MLRVIACALGALVLLATAVAAQTDARPAGPAQTLEVATFASGCFWCTESDFDKVEGVVETTSGYMGGKTPNPTYQQVSRGGTGHAEVLQLKYDPSKVTYRQLLDHYWRNVDPLDGGGQFCDRGDQYRPAIFYHTEEQKRLAEESKAALEKSERLKQPIAVEITAASAFTPAEDYHQDYYKRNPIQYFIYRSGCGRDARLEAVWGKPKA
ncbi:MAG: peptide-methionine (S)-S-oxide reductase MsrA [Hyphomicrobiaceae bacterium]|nr:peptide-methionine (S)-S-oxide reductase MsrA [Hyphomicrobiaceae bacterium]